MRVRIKSTGLIEDLHEPVAKAWIECGRAEVVDKAPERTAPVEVAVTAPAEKAVMNYSMGPRSVFRRIGFGG